MNREAIPEADGDGGPAPSWTKEDALRFMADLRRALGRGAWDVMSPLLRTHAVDSYILRILMSVRQPVPTSDVKELRRHMLDAAADGSTR